MKLHFKEKIKKQPVKKRKQIKKSPKFRTIAGKKETVFCFKVNTDILNVRKEHSEKSKIIHRYKKDDIICASTQSFSWIKTEHGWCSKDYLVRIEPFRTIAGKKETVFCFKVNTDILNVRKEHSEKSKIIHRYKKDDIICASTQSFSWIKTEHGWCSKDYLVRIEPSKSKL